MCKPYIACGNKRFKLGGVAGNLGMRLDVIGQTMVIIMCNKMIDSTTGEDDQTMSMIIEDLGHHEIGLKLKIIVIKTKHHGIISHN